MAALALGGERSAALAHYEACRRLLAEELGCEPEDETQALFARIRDGSLLPLQSKPGDPRHTARSPSGPQAGVAPPFVAREVELARLSRPARRGSGGPGWGGLDLGRARQRQDGPAGRIHPAGRPGAPGPDRPARALQCPRRRRRPLPSVPRDPANPGRGRRGQAGRRDALAGAGAADLGGAAGRWARRWWSTART